MNQEKMILEFHKVCATLYEQVSEPQYYQGQGPYLMALMINQEEIEFYCYEIMDAEAFLSAPEKCPPAFQEPEFLFKIADTLKLDGIANSGCYFHLHLRRVIPDIPACHVALQKLNATTPELIGKIFLIDDSGKLFPAPDILFKQVLLN